MGPGDYDTLKGIEHTGKKFTISSRPSDTKTDSKLGPGYYETDRGHYITSHSSAKYKMLGKSKEKVINQTMGPGDYDTLKGIEKTGKNFTIRSRPRDAKIDTKLGPGYYDTDHGHSATRESSAKW